MCFNFQNNIRFKIHMNVYFNLKNNIWLKYILIFILILKIIYGLKYRLIFILSHISFLKFNILYLWIGPISMYPPP
jgi:hypothetical protein